MPASRQIEYIDAWRQNTRECLETINSVLRERCVAESDVISVQSQMDDGGVTVWVYYWR